MIEGGALTVLVPEDEGPYHPGEVVRLDRSTGSARLSRDPQGDFEVYECAHPPIAGSRQMLQVTVRKIR